MYINTYIYVYTWAMGAMEDMWGDQALSIPVCKEQNKIIRIKQTKDLLGDQLYPYLRHFFCTYTHFFLFFSPWKIYLILGNSRQIWRPSNVIYICLTLWLFYPVSTWYIYILITSKKKKWYGIPETVAAVRLAAWLSSKRIKYSTLLIYVHVYI